MPTKKKYNARFAPARIKKIMQTDEEVGKVSAAVPVLISKALEMFLAEMMKKAEQLTTSRSAKTLTVKHLKQCIMTEKRFDFLHDAVADIPDLGLEEEEEEKQPRKRRKQSEAKSKSELCEQHSSEGDQPEDVFTALIKNEAQPAGPCSAKSEAQPAGPCSAKSVSTSSRSHSISNSISRTTTPRVNSFSIDSIMSSKLFPDLPTARVKKESTSEPVAALVDATSEPVATLVKAEPVATLVEAEPVATLVKAEPVVALVECKSELSPEEDYDA